MFREFFRVALESESAFVAIDRHDERIIGSSRYHGYDPIAREIEIGWSFLARSHWGGRHNGEMKALMLAHAFQFVDHVIFVIGPQNIRSQRAVQKLGAVLVDTQDVRGNERVVYRLSKVPSDRSRALSDSFIIVIAWIAVAVHVVIAIAVRRRMTDLPFVPLLNLATALCVLAYWGQRWYGYLTKGITWYLSDQALPLWAILVCVLSGLSLAGRYNGTLPHWLVFGIDGLVLLAAALFFTFFRMNRLF